MKKYLTKVLFFEILGVLVLICGIFWYAAQHQICYKENNVTVLSNDGNIGELEVGQKISQSFFYDGDYIREILVKVGTYERTNDATLNVILRKEEDILYEKKIPMSQLENNSDLVLNIEKNVISEKGMYLLELYSDDCDSDNTITIYSNTQSEELQGNLEINGERKDEELQIQILGDDKRKAGEYYWIYVAIILLLYCIFFYVQVLKEKKRLGGILHHIFETLTTYHFLIKQLVIRDFKTKYKRSVLGMMWSFLNPLLTMLVQYIVFSTIFRSNIENYPVYLLSASILFSFFTESVGGGLVSIVGNASLIKKVYVPKYIYPVTKVLSTSINVIISLIPLLFVVLFTGERINKAYLLIPFVLITLIIFCVGMSLIMSSLMVFFRDMQFLWSIISLLWMYATPMFYPETIIPDKFRLILVVNPMYHYISFFRTILLSNSSPQMIEYLSCIICSTLFCLIGGLIFRHTQKKFVLYL